MHLDECLKQHIPVISVVAIIGSTEESAVDPVKDIIELRNKFRRKVSLLNSQYQY